MVALVTFLNLAQPGQAGPLFLCLPSGEVLKHGEKEQWMLQCLAI